MMDLSEMLRLLRPNKAVLFLGAGASVGSGAPLAGELARRLSQLVTGQSEPLSTDLMELSGLLELKYGRSELIRALREILGALTPSGGILGLSQFEWSCIYTTNYDTLVEQAFRRSGHSISVVRNNFEYSRADTPPTLFKLHGSIESDMSDGGVGRIVLTERDYDEYVDYRETVFQRLALDLSSKDVLIVGHSLRDQHLRQMMKQAVDLKRNKGGSGRVFLVTFERDDDRAALAESQGLIVSYGDIETIGSILADRGPSPSEVVASSSNASSALPAGVATRVIDVSQAVGLQSDAQRLFAGAPASYADIHASITFARASEHKLLGLLRGEKHAVALVGVAGAGKTTLARRLAYTAHKAGMNCWELRPGAALVASAWVDVARSMAPSDRALLVIDDCTSQQRQVNLLVDGLAEIENPPLRIVLVAQTSQWATRTKTPRLFKWGHIENVGSLVDQELDALLDLLGANVDLQRLVERGFLERGRPQRLQFLRSRCSGDMFVAMKYLFSSDAIDTILLREYADLPVEIQEIYRMVAALEAAGTRVHRQLVLRLLNVRADLLAGYLAVLNGLVEEFDIDPDLGLYGWRTRHEVVARIIARYKLADQEMLVELLRAMVDSVNPTFYVERMSISAICQSEFGIKRVDNGTTRRILLERLIEHAPSERVPRHRLVRELLDAGATTEAEAAILDAERIVGSDGPLRRYRVVLLIQRATATEGILQEDRLALLAEAWRMASDAVGKSPEDKHAYLTLVQVAEARVEVSGKRDYLDEAVSRVRAGVARTLDPDLAEALRELEHRRPPRRSP